MTAELEPGLSLAGLDKGDRLEEMEFHFPLAQGSLYELASLLPTGSILHKYLTGLNDDDCIRIEEGGYLNGLVDLFSGPMVNIMCLIGNQTSLVAVLKALDRWKLRGKCSPITTFCNITYMWSLPIAS